MLVFNKNFHEVDTLEDPCPDIEDRCHDHTETRRRSPFNVSIIDDKLYVACAEQAAPPADQGEEVTGPGSGALVRFNPDGTGREVLVEDGVLDALFFASGPQQETKGLVGRLDFVEDGRCDEASSSCPTPTTCDCSEGAGGRVGSRRIAGGAGARRRSFTRVNEQ